jgi:XTP/dITP diphosphohydrolase
MNLLSRVRSAESVAEAPSSCGPKVARHAGGIVKDLLIATGNSHKTEEIRSMLGAGWEVKDLTAHPDLPAAEETGDTFDANAKLKALHISAALPEVLVLSDDSGLEVDALGGAPGVRSARYAGESASDADNRAKLKRELADATARGKRAPFTGRFRCCMALAEKGELLGTFSGSVEGTLLTKEEGTGGFGYDALFVPRGYDASFGVLPSEVKNKLSHRTRALEKVVAWLREKEM